MPRGSKPRARSIKGQISNMMQASRVTCEKLQIWRRRTHTHTHSQHTQTCKHTHIQTHTHKHTHTHTHTHTHIHRILVSFCLTHLEARFVSYMPLILNRKYCLTVFFFRWLVLLIDFTNRLLHLLYLNPSVKLCNCYYCCSSNKATQ